MIEYVYILITVLGIGLTFSISKLYQTKYSGVKALLTFSFWLAIGGFLFSFFVNGCKINFASITLWCSLIVAVTIGFDNVAGVVAFKYCKMSLYTTFIMAGGMVIPSVFGVLFLQETLSVWRILGIVAIIAALVIPVFEKTEEKTSKIGLLLCVAVFVCNGLNNVASKVHQTSANALTTQDFLIYMNVWYFLLSLAIALGYWAVKARKKSAEGISVEEKRPIDWKERVKPILLILLSSLIGSTGTSFNLLAAKTVDASLMYPLITGGGMAITALCGRIFFKEKITKLNAISLCVAVLGTVLFAF